MKKIGFIDYFLDEWHANNYPAWIAAPLNGEQYTVAYAWAAMDKPGGLTTAQWCQKFGVEQAASQQELIDKSDCIIVLSPDNPEQHETLSALALQSGKPIYVDKTFALDLAAAQRMFDLAQKHNTPMYTTSALRYATELDWLGDNGIAQREVTFVSSRGPGHFPNYSIHQIEMIVAAMGPGARRALATGTQDAPVVVFEYQDGRCAVVNHLPSADFSLAIQAGEDMGTSFPIQSNFWQGFTAALLGFFDTGKPPVPQVESYAAIAMVEAGILALQQPGNWVAVKG